MKKTILVVDDDPGIRIAISLKLRAAGFEVQEAADGEAGLKAARTGAVDLVVADVGMPRMDGYTMCELLHNSSGCQALPVIILTAQDMAIPEKVRTRLGIHEFLMKPFSPRQLLRVVQDLLAARV